MKKKIIYTLNALSILCIISCSDEDIVKTNLPNQADTDPSIEYGQIPTDSLEIKYIIQTNSNLILADRIISKGEVFILDLSKEEAEALHISDETYYNFLKYVENLNNKSEKEH